jgi:hypothetical protein
MAQGRSARRAELSVTQASCTRHARRDGHRSASSWTTCPPHKEHHDTGVGGPEQSRAVFHPRRRVLANPIESHFDRCAPSPSPVQPPNHVVATRALQAYLRWRNIAPATPRPRATPRTSPRPRRRTTPGANDPPHAPPARHRQHLWSEH